MANLVETIREMLTPLTQEGGEFEVSTANVRGVELPVFKNAPDSLIAFIEQACHTHADEISIVEGGERLTFAQVWEESGRVACVLQKRYGIQKGDRVAIAMRNYREWIFAYVGTIRAGGVIVPLNAWWTSKEIAYGLENSQTSVVFADEARAQRIAEMEDGPAVATIVARPSHDLADGFEDYAKVVYGETETVPTPVDIGPEDDASIMYTSGTTGFPKGALATHRSIVGALRCLEFTYAAITYLVPPAEGDDPFKDVQQAILITVPLFHVTGSTAIMLASLVTGRRSVFMHKWDAGEALSLIEQERVTSFTGVPTMVWEMLQHPDFDKYDTRSMKTIGCGGAPAPAAQVAQVDKSFSSGRPGIGYGLTETNAVTAINSGDFYIQKPMSCGMPAILGEIMITDDEGKAVAPNETGEICIKGSFVFKGYWKNEKATAEAFYPGGWFRSGDLGHVDDDGFLYVSDRAKDMVLRGGENVYCAEVESAIYDIAGVQEAAVYGLPDTRLGEIVACTIVPSSGASIDPESVKEHLGKSLAKFKVPEDIVISMEPLPRNASGKFLKRVVRDERAQSLGRG